MIGTRTFAPCFLLLILLVASVFSASGQALEKGWRGLLPLISTKQNVEKIFGKPENVDDNGYHNYSLDGYFVQVNYSTDPCRPNQYGRGKFNVEQDTVLDVRIHVKKELLLTELDYDRKPYYKDTSGDLLNVYDYRSRETGINITVGIRDGKGTEYVGRITYRPSEKLRSQFACPTQN